MKRYRLSPLKAGEYKIVFVGKKKHLKHLYQKARGALMALLFFSGL